jgi:hypothetical protein
MNVFLLRLLNHFHKIYKRLNNWLLCKDKYKDLNHHKPRSFLWLKQCRLFSEETFIKDATLRPIREPHDHAKDAK